MLFKEYNPKVLCYSGIVIREYYVILGMKSENIM